MKFESTVDEEHRGWRLDKYLTVQMAGRSRAQIQASIDRGMAKVNGLSTIKKGHVVMPGDRVELELISHGPAAAAEKMDLDIKYEDRWLLVVNKPAGLVVHPAPGHPGGTLVNGLMAYGASLSSLGEGFRPGIVHRLDKDTSGLLIVAKTNDCHLRLSQMLKDREIERLYLAVLRGKLPHTRGRISGPIGRHPRRRTSMAVVERGRPAETDFRVIRYFPGHTLVQVKLQTGRTHQIRVHFSHLGRPVVGDSTYGNRAGEGLNGHLLHARTLNFAHPLLGKPISVTAPPPAEFLEYLRRLWAVGER